MYLVLRESITVSGEYSHFIYAKAEASATQLESLAELKAKSTSLAVITNSLINQITHFIC